MEMVKFGYQPRRRSTSLNIYLFLILVACVRSASSSKSSLTTTAFVGNSNRININNIMNLHQRKNSKTGGNNLTNPPFSLPNIPPRGGGGSGTNSELNMTPFDNSMLWQSINTISAANGLGFVISLLTGSHLHLDLLGTGAFALAAAVPLLKAKVGLLALPLRVKISGAAVVVWGSKLAGFLFFRALQVKHDARLDQTLSSVSGTVGFWVISALWGVVCSLPHTLGTTSSNPGLASTTILGTTVFTVGLIVETLADYQKWAFKQDISNAGQFCNVGLWSISQHPNYLGNLLIWTGLLVLNGPALIDVTNTHGSGAAGFLNTFWGSRRFFIACLSPLFMWALFYGQASGAVTNSVEAAMKRYGGNPEFIKYLDKVPLIIPKLFKK